MKAVILAGGLGTRLAEETETRPKPMVEIGGRPILWHVMKAYSHFGVSDFIICLGYKGYVIKEYFANYALHMSDVRYDFRNGSTTVLQNSAEPWQVSLIDTGPETMTGGRLKRVRHFLDNEDFCFTYGDGLANIDIAASIAFHRAHGKWATVTAVRPPGRFGAIKSEGSKVVGFQEKPEGDGGLINGGFFVLSPKCIDLVASDATTWEQEPMTELANLGQLQAYRHDGFWQPMDTLRDKRHMEELWASGKAPWKVWQ
jgi:glucose-1-phosphate cytidylyltransferase